MSDSTYDLVVIGGGPAGYAAAIRAGQLGKKVACIETERAGGTCLNWGCIPSKALLKSAELYCSIQEAHAFGIYCDNLHFDFAKVIERSRFVADKMGGGIEFLFKKNKVEYIVGHGHINAPGMIEITSGEQKGTFFAYKNALIATGCKPIVLPGLTVDGKRIMTSREALAMQDRPNSITILGAGAIGVEFAYFLKSFGACVTLVEMMPKIVPVEDEDISDQLLRSFKKAGINVHTNTKADAIQVHEHGVKMDLVQGENRIEHQTECVLLAIGVRPYTEGLLAERLQLKTDKRGFIEVNDSYETNIKGIYAAGDIIGPPWLAHVATYEAVQAVHGMFNHSAPKRVKLFPGCTYCQPQIASIGLTEKAVKEQQIPYNVGKFPFTASGKAVAINHPEGFVKIITSKEHNEILGAHIIGYDATELIAEYALGMNLEATASEIHETIHAHPTLSEAMGEAAGTVFGEAIHI